MMDLRERLAKALCDDAGCVWDEGNTTNRTEWFRAAETALAVIRNWFTDEDEQHAIRRLRPYHDIPEETWELYAPRDFLRLGLIFMLERTAAPPTRTD